MENDSLDDFEDLEDLQDDFEDLFKLWNDNSSYLCIWLHLNYIGVCTASFILCNFSEGKVYISLLHTFYIVMEAVVIVVNWIMSPKRFVEVLTMGTYECGPICK